MNFKINNDDKLSLIAGPCALESYDNASFIAYNLKNIAEKLKIDYYFKVSIDKANRTSADNYRGLGFEKGIETLLKIKSNNGVRIATDIHEPWQADLISEVADIIQIPAFLARQTDLIKAAAKTGKIVNVKKPQFASPEEMGKIIGKLEYFGCNKILICERGTAFGYHNLIVDMTGLVRMKKYGYPVVFDATHSVQISGGGEDFGNSGASYYVPYLAKAAISTGVVDVLFMEIHPEPDKALCDGSCMLKLDKTEDLLKKLLEIYSLCKE